MPPVVVMGPPMPSQAVQKGHKCATTCPGCSTQPHLVVQGQATQGSPNVMAGGMHVVCQTDPGEHAACCGTGMFVATQGSSSVKVNNKGICTETCMTTHCGTPGGEWTNGYKTVVASL